MRQAKKVMKRYYLQTLEYERLYKWNTLEKAAWKFWQLTHRRPQWWHDYISRVASEDESTKITGPLEF